MARRIEMSGKRFGKWLVLEFAGVTAGGHVLWLCRCDCSKESQVRGVALRCGSSHQCFSCAHQTHGQHGTPEYRAWTGMISRCYNKRNPDFKNYGGRAEPITVCPEWRDSATAFLNYMGPKPTSPVPLSIDRINNKEGYYPGNVRWTTAKVQGNNRGDNIRVKLLFDGEIQEWTVAQWQRLIPLTKGIYQDRRRLQGMTPVEALTTPIRGQPDLVLPEDVAEE